MIKDTEKSNLKEKELSSQFKGVVLHAREAMASECEVAGHSTGTETMNDSTQPRPPAHRMVLLQAGHVTPGNLIYKVPHRRVNK